MYDIFVSSEQIIIRINIMTHFGIYGIAINEGKILVVKKEIGPYKNRYDLPGGSRKNEDEHLVETLKREIREEVGGIVISVVDSNIYDFLIEIKNGIKFLHIAVFYNICIKLETSFRISKVDSFGEKNDSSGYMWICMSDITIENSSPILLKAKEITENTTITYQTTYYSDWKVIEC